MSSGIEGEGIIAAAVLLPATAAVAVAAAALGTGWLAWQGGKLLFDANQAVDEQIARAKQKKVDAQRHRKRTAVAAHSQLIDMCKQIIAQMDAEGDGSTEIEQLKQELRAICTESLPDDVSKIESITSLGYLRLEKAVRQQKRIAEFKLTESAAGLLNGATVAELMNSLRIAISAMDVTATVGKDVKAADPDVIERAELNEKLADVAERIMLALEFVGELSANCGLTASGRSWFESCFNGCDELIATLCRPTATNKELKKGIRRLDDAYEQYEIMAPSIVSEIKKMLTLYQVYAEAAEALGEDVEKLSAFKSSEEIEQKLEYFKERAKRAEECAEIYKELGQSAYLCYAWDRELEAMGYKVHARKKITDMVSKKPEYTSHGDKKLPFYSWNDEDLTQLYAVLDSGKDTDCSLQVVVHKDGTVSMKTIAEGNNEATVAVQEHHCAQLKALHERLKKNWFIRYDYKETESAQEVTTVAAWKSADDNAWSDKKDIVTDERAKGKTEAKAKKIQ